MFSKPLLLKRNLTCVQNHGILLVFKFAQDFAGSSFLKSSKPLYDLQVCRSLLKKKKQSKQWLQSILWMKRSGELPVLSRGLLCIIAVGCCMQKKVICEKKSKSCVQSCLSHSQDLSTAKFHLYMCGCVQVWLHVSLRNVCTSMILVKITKSCLAFVLLYCSWY